MSRRPPSRPKFRQGPPAVDPPKGEVVIVVGPGKTEPDEAAALSAVSELVDAGVPRKRAADIVARLTGAARNRLYRGTL